MSHLQYVEVEARLRNIREVLFQILAALVQISRSYDERRLVSTLRGNRSGLKNLLMAV